MPGAALNTNRGRSVAKHLVHLFVLLLLAQGAGQHFGLQGGGPLAGQHLLGGIHDEGQDTLNPALWVKQRLVDKVYIPQPGLASGGVEQPGGGFGAPMGLSRSVHLVQQLEKALPGYFRKHVGYPQPQPGAVAGQRLVAFVEVRVAVLGPRQRGNGRRHLPQNLLGQVRRRGGQSGGGSHIGRFRKREVVHGGSGKRQQKSLGKRRGGVRRQAAEHRAECLAK